jgi:Gas vesicle synthesis protein GvpL/GvpF
MQSEVTEREYLYCFLRESSSQTFISKGMGDRGDPVTSIHYRDLGAVISTSSIAEYESNRRNMMTHTRVLEEVMGRYSILPIRFNTTAPDRETIYKLLCQRYDELQGLLNDMMGKTEMGLKALWYEGVVFDEILAENPNICRLRDELQRHTPEETYYERIRLGEMIEQALEQKRQDEATLILDTLRAHVCDIKANQIISDRMIVNTAFLIELKKEPDLEAAIQVLDAQMGRRILFRYIGPAPPYNFVNFVLAWNGANPLQ